MTGTTRKISASNAALEARDICALTRDAGGAGCVSGLRDPSIAETGIIADAIEIGIDLPEFFPDALDESPNIGTVSLGAIAGDEILPMDQIIYIAIRHVLPRARDHKDDDVKFGESEVELLRLPIGAAGIGPQGQGTVLDRPLPAGAGIGDRAPAFGDEHDPLQQDREPFRLVDEVDGSALERRLFIDVVAEHGQEDHGNGQ